MVWYDIDYRYIMSYVSCCLIAKYWYLCWCHMNAMVCWQEQTRLQCKDAKINKKIIKFCVSDVLMFQLQHVLIKIWKTCWPNRNFNLTNNQQPTGIRVMNDLHTDMKLGNYISWIYLAGTLLRHSQRQTAAAPKHINTFFTCCVHYDPSPYLISRCFISVHWTIIHFIAFAFRRTCDNFITGSKHDCSRETSEDTCNEILNKAWKNSKRIVAYVYASSGLDQFLYCHLKH